MDSLHFIGFILMLSILFQMVSAVMAIRLINISGKRTAWIFITVAIVLMAVRRMIPFMRILTGDQSVHPDLLNEIIGLVISVFMAVGIAFIAPLFIERKRVEGRIRQLNTELEEHVAQRTAQLEAANKELEAFAYSVAHDLRSPLRGVEGFSQILLEEYHDKLDKQGKNYLRRLTSAAHRMDQLIDDLLNLSCITRKEMNIRLVHLSEMALEIAENLREHHPDREVEFVIQEGMEAKCDGHLLHTALENLLDNAVKFSSQKNPALIEFGMFGEDRKTVYYVRDNGVGFEMKYVQKLFGAFQRLHDVREFPGTGIGLVIVQRIIQRHGGKVWAEGEVGKGATFYFTVS